MRDERGMAVFLLVMVVLAGGALIFASLAVSVLGEVRIGRDSLAAAQAYYTAEAGIEDALLRLQPGRITSVVQPYSFAVASSSATVNVGPNVGGTRVVTSQGDFQAKKRKVEVNASLGTSQVSFFYGAQVGEGGLVMSYNTSVIGNVFSNGPVDGTGLSSDITGTVEVSGNNGITDVDIGGDAYADSFSNCEVSGTAHYVSSIASCPAGVQQQIATPPDPVALPIGDSQVQLWKDEAASGGTLSGYTLGNNQSATLGLKKIDGDLTIGNSSILTLQGTIWVTGTINFGNTPIVQLDQASYGSLSGVIVVDGGVVIDNKAAFKGTGQTGSYLMLLSMATGLAIDAKNTATGSLLYAPNGTIAVGNNLSAREATAYRLELSNGVSITYETGLASAAFTSGPSAGWRAVGWIEIE